MTTDVIAALREEIANLEDAVHFRLRSHEKIVPMGAGEIRRLIALLESLARAMERGKAAWSDGERVLEANRVNADYPGEWRPALVIPWPEGERAE
jgi:hypothetical protein